MQIVKLNERGLTLIEVLIAALITLVLFLALMQSALLSIDMNTGNSLRDEAVGIAEMRMGELRNMSFTDPALADTYGTPIDDGYVQRDFRNFNIPFTRTRAITNLGPDNKQIDITVTWEWKERTVANGNPFTHSISTIVRRQ